MHVQFVDLLTVFKWKCTKETSKTECIKANKSQRREQTYFYREENANCFHNLCIEIASMNDECIHCVSNITHLKLTNWHSKQLCDLRKFKAIKLLQSQFYWMNLYIYTPNINHAYKRNSQTNHFCDNELIRKSSNSLSVTHSQTFLFPDVVDGCVCMYDDCIHRYNAPVNSMRYFSPPSLSLYLQFVNEMEWIKATRRWMKMKWMNCLSL